MGVGLIEGDPQRCSRTGDAAEAARSPDGGALN